MPRTKALLEILKIAKAENVSDSEAWRLFRSRVGTARTRKELAHAEMRYQNGEREAIISALYLCAWHDYPLPAWLADEVVRGCESYLMCQERTLDAALNIKRPKSLNVTARGVRMKKANRVFLTVNTIRAREHLSGNDLFSAASEVLGMGARQVKEVYQTIRKEQKKLPA